MDTTYLTEELMGKRIFFLPITEDDTEKLIGWRNKPEIRNCFLDRRTLTKEMHNRWLEENVYTGRVYQWIIYEKSVKRPIGSTYLKDIDYTNRKCEFGIFIGELERIGMGYGVDACETVCEFAFSKIKMAKVFLRVLADNQAAIMAYRSAGFIEEGVFSMDRWIDDKPVDVIYMAKFNPNDRTS